MEVFDIPHHTVMEGMTSLSALFHALESGVNDRKILSVLYDKQRASKRERDLAYLFSQSTKYQFPLHAVDASTLAEYTSGTTHGGIIALCSDRTIPPLTPDLICPEGFYVMLEGIEDPYNFGTALRSLYAAGADGVILSPRNWMSAAGVVARVSAGTSELFPMAVSGASEAVEVFRTLEYQIVCAGIRDSVPIDDADLKKPLFLLIGGEKRGISAEVLKKADKIVRIEYGRTFRGSLSASATAAVFGFEILKQNKGEKE